MMLKETMSESHRRALGTLPTYHGNCLSATGVARPGKTRRDKLRGVQRFGPNRR